jgi:polyisoprenoid-binding protein YceI
MNTISARLRARLMLAPLLVLALSAGASAETISGDPGHSSATFSVKHFSITTVTGVIPVQSWSATAGPSLIPQSITATLDATGIDTKQADRDNNLRGPDWLNTGKYPTLTFKSSKIEAGPDNTFKATGDLTINGVTKPVTFDGKFEGSITDGRGNKRAGYTATATVDRRDFGLNFAAKTPGGALVAGYDVTLTIQAEGIVKS